MRLSTATAAALAAALGGLCSLLAATQLSAQGVSVKIESFKFAPATVSADANAAITWTNSDAAPHQVVVGSKNLKTAVLQKGQSGQLAIAEKGSYDYVCGIHPGMKGKIEIK